MIFTKTQQAAIKLMKQDLQYLYTIIMKHNDVYLSNDILSLMPYIGVVIDGVEDWLKSYNNSHKEKLNIPLFSKEEQEYYEEMRSSIKLWDNSYHDIYNRLEVLYQESDNYFASISNPLVKELNLYDIFGTDVVNGKFCGNTILCGYYTPKFSFYKSMGEYIKRMSGIAGKITACFNATQEYDTNINMNFDMEDFGGLIKSPVGNEFSDKFVLFSILCQINFVVYCVDKYIIPEIPIKLRISYLLYYYLLRVLSEVNEKIKSNFILDNKWDSQLFRNAMAHYKLGVSLKESEIDETDMMFGITNKFFGQGYKKTKNAILLELKNLSNQIECYLNL